MDEQRMLSLVSMLLKDREHVRWPVKFLSLAYAMVAAEGRLTFLQGLVAILELCAAYDTSEDLVKTINWVRRAAEIN